MTGSGNEPSVKHHGRQFYNILERTDGRVDVFLDARVYPCTVEDTTDYDIMIHVVRGIDPADFRQGLENHIREHRDDWKEIAEVVWL